jgi:hypothetical protein
MWLAILSYFDPIQLSDTVKVVRDIFKILDNHEKVKNPTLATYNECERGLQEAIDRIPKKTWTTSELVAAWALESYQRCSYLTTMVERTLLKAELPDFQELALLCRPVAKLNLTDESKELMLTTTEKLSVQEQPPPDRGQKIMCSKCLRRHFENIRCPAESTPCRVCGNKGHWAGSNVCPKKTKPSNASADEYFVIKLPVGSPDPMMGSVLRHWANKEPLSWSEVIVDSGCSHSATPCQQALENFCLYSKPSSEYMTADGNDSTLKVFGHGDLRLAIRDGKGNLRGVILRRVRYVPNLLGTLLSEVQLESLGLPMVLDRLVCSNPHLGRFSVPLSRKGGVKRVQVGTPFPLSELPTGGNLFVTNLALVAQARSRSVSSIQAHRIFHCPNKVLTQMRGLTRNLKIYDVAKSGSADTDTPVEWDCLECLIGTSKVKTHPRGPHVPRSSAYGEWFHWDFSGRKVWSSRQGSDVNQFLLGVDDHSRWIHPFFVGSTSEAGECLRSLCKESHLENGAVTMQMDRDPSLFQGDFRTECDRREFRVVGAVPHEHASNGVAERSIGLVVPRVNAMLLQCHLPVEVAWPYCVEYACAVLSVTPRKFKRGDGKEVFSTSYYERFHRFPDVSIFHPFGCLAIVHDPNFTKRDFGPRGKLGVFLGLDPLGPFGTFRIYSLTSGRVVAARSVDFVEHCFPRADESYSAIQARIEHPPLGGSPGPVVWDEPGSAVSSGPVSAVEPRPFDCEVFSVTDESTPKPGEPPDDLDESEVSSVASFGGGGVVAFPDDLISPSDSGDDGSDAGGGNAQAPPCSLTQLSVPTTTISTVLDTPAGGGELGDLTGSNAGGGDDDSALDSAEESSESSSSDSSDSEWISDGDAAYATLEHPFRTKQGLAMACLEEMEVRRSVPDLVELQPDEKGLGPNDTARKLLPVPKDWRFQDRVEKVYAEKPFSEPVTVPRNSRELKDLTKRDQQLWYNAMCQEVTGLKEKWIGTHAHVVESEVSAGRAIAVDSMFVFDEQWKDGDEESGRWLRIKARCCARGDQEKQKADQYWFAPTITTGVLMLMWIVALTLGLFTAFLDIGQAFLHAEFKDRVVYVRAPHGLKMPYPFYKLTHSLYGLSSSPAMWFAHLKEKLLLFGLQQSSWEPCLFYDIERRIFVLVYVDDLCIFAGKQELVEVREHLANHKLDVTESKNGFYLGLKWDHKPEEKSCFVDQSEYASKILDAFGMQDSHPVCTPGRPNDPLRKDDSKREFPLYRKLVGKLMYLTLTRPDLSYAVKELARHASSSNESHWQRAKRVLRYVKGTLGRGILLVSSPEPMKLRAYVDASHANCPDTRRGTSGSVILLGSSPVFFRSKTQHTVASASWEAEIYAALDLVNEVVFFRRLLEELGLGQDGPTEIFIDAESALKTMLKDPGDMSGRARCIDIRLKKIREFVEECTIIFRHVPTKANPADVLTKDLPTDQHVFLSDKIMESKL